MKHESINKPVFIYHLVCPIWGNCVYVGQTMNPKKREAQLLDGYGNKRLSSWIKAIHPRKPKLQIQKIVNVQNRLEEEKREIRKMKPIFNIVYKPKIKKVFSNN